MILTNIELRDITGGCKALRKAIKVIGHALLKAYKIFR